MMEITLSVKNYPRYLVVTLFPSTYWSAAGAIGRND